MEDFHSVLEECELEDIDYIGLWITWELGNFPETNIRERLNRGVATVAWGQFFSDFLLRHLPHSFFDHYPLLIRTN